MDFFSRALEATKGPAGLPADPAARHRAVRQRGEKPSPEENRPDPELVEGEGNAHFFPPPLYCLYILTIIASSIAL
jgi:hypothetical protein